MNTSYTKLSRVASRVLRHEPWLYELELDEEGWTPIAPMLEALSSEFPEWRCLSIEDLQSMIAQSPKKRHEIVGERIRALYGHSVPGHFQRHPQEPPEILYHGTSRRSYESISSSGLKPMGRQYVHLSANSEMAVQVGTRKDREPLILKIEARKAHESGISFYRGHELIWLVEFLPPDYVSVLHQEARVKE
jgi:putative RNA 2'-phosphotransferase